MNSEDQLNSAIAVYRQYQNALIAESGPVRSVIHQQIEITNGNFTFHISSDGEFIKIERKGASTGTDRGGFFLIPIEMWDEVVNFVFQETQRRKADGEAE